MSLLPTLFRVLLFKAIPFLLIWMFGICTRVPARPAIFLVFRLRDGVVTQAKLALSVLLTITL